MMMTTTTNHRAVFMSQDKRRTIAIAATATKARRDLEQVHRGRRQIV